MKRDLYLDLIPVSGFNAGDHAVCPFTDCGALMCFDADRGELVCPDCRVSASDAYELAQAVLVEVAS